MPTNGKTIGSLVITNPDLLPYVQMIAYDIERLTLQAVAISPHGSRQEFIRFLEPRDASDASGPCATATGVDQAEFRGFLQEVETLGERMFGRRLQNYSMPGEGPASSVIVWKPQPLTQEDDAICEGYPWSESE
jgi:hypothetical protein